MKQERLIYLDSQGMIHPKLVEEIRKIIYVPFAFPKDILMEKLYPTSGMDLKKSREIESKRFLNDSDLKRTPS